MYEMYFQNNYKGTLPNGGYIGMNFAEMEKIDPTLEYNDDDEDFSSKDGYWLLDDIDTKKVVTITIFLSVVETDDFYDYEWVNEYL